MENEMICLRDKIGEFLCEFAREDKRIYVIDSDLAKSTKTLQFEKEFPDRFVETGISEASAVSIATGLATEGQIPFYVNFAIFVAGTAWTQVRQAAYANSNIKLIGTYAGMDNGKDGASHHANEDIALMRAIPNVKILVPSNVKEMKEAIKIAIEYNGPVYIRIARDNVPNVEFNGVPEIGKSTIVKNEGNDFAELYILPYLKGVKKIEKEPDYTWKTLEGDFDDSGSYENAKPQYVLPDGKLLAFNGHPFLNAPNPLNRPKTHLRINVDINGYKGPNRYGRDVFVFSIVPNPKSLKGQFVPGPYEQFTNGGFHFRLTREELTTSGSSTCKTDGTGRGYACANLIIMDGWQIKNDYPWK